MNVPADPVEFVHAWVQDNITATGFEPEGDSTEARKKAMECWAAADKAGIPRAAIDAEFGSLDVYMAKMIEEANDAEVDRLANKDD